MKITANWVRCFFQPRRQYANRPIINYNRTFSFIAGSMAKYAASTCATNNAHECIQILGGKGFVSGKSERYYRDARITQIYGGATDIQKLIVADQVVNEMIPNSSSWTHHHHQSHCYHHSCDFTIMHYIIYFYLIENNKNDARRAEKQNNNGGQARVYPTNNVLCVQLHELISYNLANQHLLDILILCI